MIWDNMKNPNKSILVKKKDKQYRQSGIPLTKDSYLFMKPNLAKIQLWIRSSASNGELFNHLSRAVHYNLRWKGGEKLPSTEKKRLFRKKFKRHYLSCNQKLASTQTHGSPFLDRIQKVQNSK